MRLIDEQTTWRDCEAVVICFPWDTKEQGTLHEWLIFNVGSVGVAWEKSSEQRPPMETEFLFADPKDATLFALRWGHFIVTDRFKQ